jgi:hypothetical protein
MLNEYYLIAPEIVRGIESSVDRNDILRKTLEIIQRAVKHIEAGRSSEALVTYYALFESLKNRFHKT